MWRGRLGNASELVIGRQLGFRLFPKTMKKREQTQKDIEKGKNRFAKKQKKPDETQSGFWSKIGAKWKRKTMTTFDPESSFEGRGVTIFVESVFNTFLSPENEYIFYIFLNATFLKHVTPIRELRKLSIVAIWITFETSLDVVMLIISYYYYANALCQSCRNDLTIGPKALSTVSLAKAAQQNANKSGKTRTKAAKRNEIWRDRRQIRRNPQTATSNKRPGRKIFFFTLRRSEFSSPAQGYAPFQVNTPVSCPKGHAPNPDGLKGNLKGNCSIFHT